MYTDEEEENPFDRDASEFYTSDVKMPTTKKSKIEKLEHPEQSQLKGECYIGFPKLLQDEIQSINKKDSFIFNTLVSHISLIC
jgi:hypothetical protein